MRLFRVLSSFRFKVTVLVTAMVFSAAIGVGAISLFIAESEMRNVIARQEMSLLSSASAHIETDLKAKRQLLLLLAEEAHIRKTSLSDIQGLLEEHAALRNDFFNVAAFDTDGTLIANLNDRLSKQINIAGRPHFLETIARGEGIISPPFRSPLSGKPVITLTQPIKNEFGIVTAVLVAAIDLERPTFAGQLSKLHEVGHGYVFLIHGEGAIIHHPDKYLVLQRTFPNSGIAQAVHEPDGWRDDIVDNGAPVLVAHKKLTTVNWTIAAVYPIRTAFAPMLEVRLRAFAAATLFAICAALLGWVLAKHLLRPLAKLQHHVENFDSTSTDISVFDVKTQDEFGVLSRALYTLSLHRQKAENDLHRIATTDSLTGASNRRMFDDLLPKALARASRSNEFIALAFLDIDKFKSVNDSYGHAIGDAVLVEFAKRLGVAVRSTDTVVRLAGDEFVIVFEQLHSVDETEILGRKILDAMKTPFVLGPLELEVSTSAGIAITTGEKITAEVLLSVADKALYKVKAAGRKGYAVEIVNNRSPRLSQG